MIRRHHGVSTSQDTRRTHRRDQANACRSPCKFMAMEFSSLSSIRSDRRKRSARPQRQQSQQTDKRKTSDREQLVADVPDLNSSPAKRGRSGGDVTEKSLVNDVNGESRHAPVADDAANKRRRLKDRPMQATKLSRCRLSCTVLGRLQRRRRTTNACAVSARPHFSDAKADAPHACS